MMCVLAMAGGLCVLYVGILICRDTTYICVFVVFIHIR